jgi:retron-type reverse transcriptase
MGKTEEVCVVQNAETVVAIIRKRGEEGKPLERVYRHLFNRDVFLRAYGRIAKNNGAMTPGVNDETADGRSLAKIDTIIDLLRHERYGWLPVRRTDIPKRQGKKRPLGLPTWSDKLVQAVIRLILEAYYEPQFSDLSHGFRPKRGCPTALREVYYKWRGTTWFIEGDIAQCFDKLDHQMLLATLAENIHDGRFIALFDARLNAGYIEDWQFNTTPSSTPPGVASHSSAT